MKRLIFAMIASLAILTCGATAFAQDPPDPPDPPVECDPDCDPEVDPDCVVCPPDEPCEDRCHYHHGYHHCYVNRYTGCCYRPVFGNGCYQCTPWGGVVGPRGYAHWQPCQPVRNVLRLHRNIGIAAGRVVSGRW